jgi:hypothetical protein
VFEQVPCRSGISFRTLEQREIRAGAIVWRGILIAGRSHHSSDDLGQQNANAEWQE